MAITWEPRSLAERVETIEGFLLERVCDNASQIAARLTFVGGDRR